MNPNECWMGKIENIYLDVLFPIKDILDKVLEKMGLLHRRSPINLLGEIF